MISTLTVIKNLKKTVMNIFGTNIEKRQEELVVYFLIIAEKQQKITLKVGLNLWLIWVISSWTHILTLSKKEKI